jgi:uncharacterized protein YuzE
MQMQYDPKADALYIHLTAHTVIRTMPINPNFNLDLDEAGEVVGIEILNVRKSGIDPLALEVMEITPDDEVERPDPEAIRKGRIARMEALKRQQRKETQDT